MDYEKIWDLSGKKWRAKRQRKSRKTENVNTMKASNVASSSLSISKASNLEISLWNFPPCTARMQKPGRA
jgi:hypothetical protein